MDEANLVRLIQESASETRKDVREVAEETRRHFDVVAGEMRQDVREVAKETRRHFDVVAEAIRRDVQLVAEGFGQLSSRLDRETADLREEMKRGFAETQAMIKFS